MNPVSQWLNRVVAFGLVMVLAAPLGVASAQEQAAPTQRAANGIPPAPPARDAAPVPLQAQDPATQLASLPDSPTPVPQNTADPQQQSTPQPATQRQSAPSQPMGTAAAPAEPAGGVAASRPAGAAIAPAKQKRTRTLVIRMSLLIGAAVAVGTVVALSSASPSRP